jgi:hypothetical protein
VRGSPGLGMCSKLQSPFRCGAQACLQAHLPASPVPLFRSASLIVTGALRTSLSKRRWRYRRNIQVGHGSQEPSWQNQSDFVLLPEQRGACPIPCGPLLLC